MFIYVSILIDSTMIFKVFLTLQLLFFASIGFSFQRKEIALWRMGPKDSYN